MTIEEQDAFRIAIAEAAGIPELHHCLAGHTHEELAKCAAILADALWAPTLHRHRTAG